ncbi:M23 family metallopeptidase [Atopomonas sediminilitoris]|uniref:M23 family metallopeptidase n=1 Tax=Atopomonas sediminilitoris TaxID=2919919 RepID=UPI001F4DEF5B|nr:M23 family metallopeptidase [Atopomonas sediminilitoris]MCJ8169857.1 M23 family metallopeptidase [Atopomonas sediminilitoris]
MQVIILSRRGSNSTHISGRWLGVSALLASKLVLALGLTSGLLLAQWQNSQAVGGDGLDVAMALQFQRENVREARADAQRQLDALAVHMGRLQARMMRVDALGERLVDIAELDSTEFDFALDVAQGGPAEELENLPAYAPPSFMETLSELENRLGEREMQLDLLESLMAERSITEASTLAGRPVSTGYISSPFGRRVDPVTGRSSMHKGVDFAARAGTDVVAVAAGVVTWSGRRPAYGNTVELTHADGYVTRYAHNRSNTVKVGDLVQSGQQIAHVGSTGRSTGNHVHFEVFKNGRLVNPSSFIARSSLNP